MVKKNYCFAAAGGSLGPDAGTNLHTTDTTLSGLYASGRLFVNNE